jgi:hypothetical protein
MHTVLAAIHNLWQHSQVMLVSVLRSMGSLSWCRVIVINWKLSSYYMSSVRFSQQWLSSTRSHGITTQNTLDNIQFSVENPNCIFIIVKPTKCAVMQCLKLIFMQTQQTYCNDNHCLTCWIPWLNYGFINYVLACSSL